jgi:glycosyltransferase involved in cell wall biosynthesis
MEHRDDVHFLGFVPADDLPRLVGSALALVYVSVYEGFGLPVVEAMASGTPVVAAHRAALPEVAGDAALFVEPLDPESIAAALERLAADPELRAGLVRRGLERARRYDWNLTATAVRDALARIARPRA